MNQAAFKWYDLLIPIVCYGMLTGSFLHFLKIHFKAGKINQGLFAFFLFTGFIVMEILFAEKIWSDSLCRILGYLLFIGLIILAFWGAWQKKILAAIILIAGTKLIVDFCASFLGALGLIIWHGILGKSEILSEPWQESFIIILSYLITAAVLWALSKKIGSLFEGKTEKWYLMTSGPLVFMILVVDVYNWSVSRGVIFWGGEGKGLYENQLFSHGAVCVLTAVCMFAGGFYVYGMQRIYGEWQKKEQYRLRMVYLEGLKEQNVRMDRIRHDMKNHIISMQGLLASGNFEKLGEYLDRIAETGGITGIEEVTGSRALDSLLYDKRKRAEGKNIIWQCDMQPLKKSMLDEFDFCVLAGNGLDNAIKACERVEDEAHRFIHIQTCQVKNYFLFEIKNSVCINAVGKAQTHGIGLLNMKETVEKYNGIMSTEYKDGAFILSVMIPMESLTVETVE